MKSNAGRSIGIGGAMLALIAAAGGLTATLYTGAPCACISTNEGVVIGLREIDEFVQRYVSEHGGSPPSFKEVASMARQTPSRYLPNSRIRNDIDPDTQKPTFTPSEGDQATFLYALSTDGRSYALAGIGLLEVRRMVFGVPLWRVRNDFPVLRPGSPLSQGTPQFTQA